MSRSLVLNAFLMDAGHHESAWRLPQSDPRVGRDVGYYQRLAQTAERGRFDSVFFADGPLLWHQPDRRPSEMLDPLILLSAMAVATEHIGLIATATTTFEEPYTLARKFQSLDVISGGRAGWNVVTTASELAASNFGSTPLPSAEDRYARAAEFVDIVLGLWQSWAEDAVLADKEAGIFADPARIRTLDHHGKHFDVRGPLNVGRSDQGHPVIVQAGSSDAGIALAGRFGEAIFTAQPTLAEAQAFYTRLKGAVADAGRNPDHTLVLPGIVPIIGSTVAEAVELEKALGEHVSLIHPHEQLAGDTGLSVEELPLDEPLPTTIRPVEEQRGSTSRYQLTIDMARRDNLTVRQLLLRLGGGRGHRTFAGTPEQVADTIETWFTQGAADGFNIMPALLPSGLELFVDHVVPILQERDLFRREYEGTTLRENYRLPRPSSGYAAKGEV